MDYNKILDLYLTKGVPLKIQQRTITRKKFKYASYTWLFVNKFSKKFLFKPFIN